ncbi:hypothetical protein L5F51_04825 [Aliarcobacter butzleri]|nr:hypothetical protein [Aliarcobacter butzleri]MCG3692500.1 hypothetical protein [Aliarcobacter butzleri]
MTNRIARLDTINYDDESKAERKHTEYQKGNREPQYILRNKYVDSNMSAYVKIWTDEEEFKREVVKIRAGGQDYTPKTSLENGYFSSVVLSQDGIDNFLKARDDKARYDIFINYFGDEELAKYYNNIELLGNKNKKEKDELTKKIDEIGKILKEPIDETIFQFTNEKINEFNKTGQQLEVIGNDFDEIKKLQFEEKLSEQKVELSRKIEYFQLFINNLSLFLGDSEKYFKHKAEWEKAKVELKDYEELYKTCAEIQFLKENIQKTQTQKINYERLQQTYPRYKIILSEIEVKDNELRKTKLKQNHDEESLNQINNDYTELSKQIELAEENKKQCTDLLDGAPKVYENIKELKNKLGENKVSLESQKKLFEGYQTEIKLLNENKKKFELTIESIKNNIFLDIDSDEKYQSDVKNIESWIKDNNSKLESLKLIKIKQEQYQQYNEQIKSLISLGINIIDKKHTDICPLCNTKQDTYEILKNKVLNNPLLNALEKELLEQTEQINYAIKVNDKNIKDRKESIILNFDKEIQEIKTKLFKLEYEIKKIGLESLQKEIQEQELLLRVLHNKIDNKSEENFKSSKREEVNVLAKNLATNYEKKKQLENLYKVKKESVELIKVVINNIEKDVGNLRQKEEYKIIFNFTLLFEQKIDIEEVLNERIESCKLSIKGNNANFIILNDKFNFLMKQYNVINIDEIEKTIKELKDKIVQLYAKEILTFESLYEQYFKQKIDNPKKVKKDISDKHIEIEKDLVIYKKSIEIIEILEKSTVNLLKYIESKNKQKEIDEYKSDLVKKIKVSKKICLEKKRLERKINKDVESFFHEELINQIYSKIDPHPEFKKVQFQCSFEGGVGRLNVFVIDDTNNKHISPSLYYSTAQLNVLSLSIFLAKALNAKDDKGNNVDCIFIDDPIQSMDSINILATIDLFRSLVANYGKQIILSTHDENFHRLLEKKIPKEYFDSKFIELETFGTVKKEI